MSYIIRKVKPVLETEVYYSKTDTRHTHHYKPEPEDALEFPTRKTAMDRLFHIKSYGEELEVVSLEEAMLERDMEA